MSARLPILRTPPPPALALQAPRRATPMLLGRLAPLFLAEGRLYVADGANSFDPYVFSQEARRRGLGDEVLDRIYVTRAFTIHQLAAVTEHMLPPLLAAGHPMPAIAVLGLDHLFLEETLRAAERARVLKGVIENLLAVQRGGARLLVTHEKPPQGQRWWRPMLEFGDMRGRVLERDNEWQLEIERYPQNGTDIADIQQLVAAGDRFVAHLSAGPQG